MELPAWLTWDNDTKTLTLYSDDASLENTVYTLSLDVIYTDEDGIEITLKTITFTLTLNLPCAPTGVTGGDDYGD
jgi:hypothetical protein